MATSIADAIGKGITPQAFIEGMTKNQEAFKEGYEGFTFAGDEEEFYDSVNNRDDLRCMILMAEWCGDVIRNVPVVFRLMEKAGVPTEVLIIEEHEELMNQHLTSGGRAIPIVLIVDTGGYLLGKWGPRPKHVQAAMLAFKERGLEPGSEEYNTEIQPVCEEMRRRYGDIEQTRRMIATELRELISSV